MQIQPDISKDKEHIDRAISVFSSGRFERLLKKIFSRKGFEPNDSQSISTFVFLLEAMEVEYRCLDHDYRHNEFTTLSLLAWRARNFLELGAWCRFCCANKDNAKLFFKEAGKDELDLRETLEKWGRTNNQDLDWFEEQEALKEIALKEAERHGIIDLNAKFMTAQKAANEAGYGGTFFVHNKTLSKFVHPTAYRLFMNEDKQADARQAYNFVSRACVYFYDAFHRLECFIDGREVENTK